MAAAIRGGLGFVVDGLVVAEESRQLGELKVAWICGEGDVGGDHRDAGVGNPDEFGGAGGEVECAVRLLHRGGDCGGGTGSVLLAAGELLIQR